MTSLNPVRTAYNYVVGNSDQQNQELADKINEAIKDLLDDTRTLDLGDLFDDHPDEVIAALKQRETPPLCEAVEKNRESAVWELLKIIPSEIDTPNSDGLTPLLLASKQGSDSLVQELLSGDADIQRTDSSGCTALMWAVLSGIVELVRSLLGAGAIPSVDVQDKDGNTALMFAIMNMKGSHRDSHGIDINKQLVYNLLIGANANVTLTNNAGDTALGLMASQPAFDRSIAYKLYTKPDDLRAQNRDGLTPIALASRSGNTEAVRFLIDRMNEGQNIGIDMKDKQGRTALYYAMVSGNADIAKQLVLAGADLQSMDEKVISELVKIVGSDINWLKGAAGGEGPGEKTSSIDMSKAS